MSRLDHSNEIICLAAQLGLARNAPVKKILDHCRRRIDGWVSEEGGIADVEALEALVTRKLQMVFEEVRTDADFDRIIEIYVKGKKEIVFAAMRSKFDDEENATYGALVLRKNVTLDSPDRYVAVIDCRGQKLARRFFTRWHEIAHRLTSHADGGAIEPGYRSEHDPLERMMDEIAAHVGFYEPIFDPVFKEAIKGKPQLTFRIVEAVVAGAFSAASFQSTLFACARRLTTPVIYLEAKLAYKKEVKARLETPSLFDDEPPPGELRAVKVRPNEAAMKDGFHIPRNMRIPPNSVIHQLFDVRLTTDGVGQENLNQWESQGKKLEQRAVVVEARKVADRVIAIIQPTEVRSQKKEQPNQVMPMFALDELDGAGQVGEQ